MGQRQDLGALRAGCPVPADERTTLGPGSGACRETELSRGPAFTSVHRKTRELFGNISSSVVICDMFGAWAVFERFICSVVLAVNCRSARSGTDRLHASLVRHRGYSSLVFALLPSLDPVRSRGYSFHVNHIVAMINVENDPKQLVSRF